MSQRPWMPLYITDYRVDTAHLNATQHGAYLLLIMHYWATGGLPTDDAQLARIACLSVKGWKKIRPVIGAFFTDNWKHKRIEYELANIAKLSAAGRAGGLASAEARRKRSVEFNRQSPEGGSTETTFGDREMRSKTKKLNGANDLTPTIDQRSFDEIANGSTTDFNYSHSHSHTDTHSEKKERIPPSAAAPEVFDDLSPEDQFWSLAAQLSEKGIARSRAGQLLKLNDGDSRAALSQLRDAARAKHPSSYLGKIIANLKAEQAPPPKMDASEFDDEPEIIREYRRDGYPVERRPNGTWKAGGYIYDRAGQVCGF